MACDCRALRNDNIQQNGTFFGPIPHIQDPADRACTYSVNHGWLNIAVPDSKKAHRED